MISWVLKSGVVCGSICLLAAGALRAAPRASETHQEFVFQPHRAVYDVTLERAAAGSSIANLNGRMVYELSGNACEGYSQKLRFVTRTTNKEGVSQLNDLRSTSWESVSSGTLRFDVENYHDDALAEASKGTAKRGSAAGALNVSLTKPHEKIVPLSQDTLFPIAHSMAVLRAAQAGQTIFPSVFYDGSENGQKVYQTTAVIGKKINAQPLSAAESKKASSPTKLAHTAAGWPIAMSYYPAGERNEDGTPAFEMSYRFHLNGVTSRFLIDHGDFAFKGALSQLVFTAPAGCTASQNDKN